MSTRALYGFKDVTGTFWVYVHYDGYPEGAAEKFKKTLESGKVWPLPRFEANEFAAGFVTANKMSDGGVRLSNGPAAHGDIEYVYIVYKVVTALHVSVEYPNGGGFLYSGTLDGFIKTAATLEEGR